MTTNRKTRVTDFLRDFIVPPTCACCRERLTPCCDVPFCSECHEKWEEEKRERCGICGLSMLDCRCLPPLLTNFGIRDGIFLSAYRAGGATVTDRLIYYVKSERDRRAFDFLARELSHIMRGYLRMEGIDSQDVIVTALPRRRAKVREIGFDQAKELAASLAFELGCEYRILLVRRRGGKEQKALNAEDRLRNLQAAFRLKGFSVLSGKTVLLVDDVMTTGSGLRSSAELLQKGGAHRVVPVTVARTVAAGEAAKKRH